MQLLSGFGCDDVLHDDLVLVLEAVGAAQEHHGVAEEAGEEDLPAAGDLCGVAVRLGHPWRRLDQVVLEWGDVQSRSICAIEYKNNSVVTVIAFTMGLNLKQVRVIYPYRLVMRALLT